MVLREITVWAIIIRILTAILVGGIIGMERELKNRPAGMRTYMLVCVGSCLIMLTNQYLYQVTHTGDPMRLGAQVVSGIGFLGAGTIMVTKHNQISGLEVVFNVQPKAAEPAKAEQPKAEYRFLTFADEAYAAKLRDKAFKK